MSETVIKCTSLCRNYGSFRAVKDLSIEVKRGEILAITGANGSGKTTLMKMLCGILSPTSGGIYIEKPLGYMSQSLALMANMTARENYNFYGVINSLSTSEIEKRFGLASELFRFDRFDNKRVEELTAGWKQLLSFSIAMMGEPKVLLLDEPTAGVDTLTRQKIWDCIKLLSENGTAVVVTSHYLSEARLCSSTLYMERVEQFERVE